MRVVTIIIIYAITRARARRHADLLDMAADHHLLFARRLRGHELQWQGVTTGDDNQRRQVDIVAVAGH